MTTSATGPCEGGGSRRSGPPGRTITLPSWAVSLALHVAALGILASVTWSASQVIQQREVKVGIVVKRQTPRGEVYRDQEHSFEAPGDRAAERPVEELVPTPDAAALSLPEQPPVEVPSIGLRGAVLSGAGQMLAVPETGVSPGGVARVSFFDATVWGSKFVFVIDRSGSMSQRDALGAAKRELLSALASLPAEARFQIIFYNNRPAMMPSGRGPQRLLSATRANKSLAGRFLGTITAEGGTEHVLALEPALKLAPDVIFFLTDAADMQPDDVRYVTNLNRGRSRIHTIEFGLGADIDQQPALRQLAEQNGGTYRYVDVTRLGSGR